MAGFFTDTVVSFVVAAIVIAFIGMTYRVCLSHHNCYLYQLRERRRKETQQEEMAFRRTEEGKGTTTVREDTSERLARVERHKNKRAKEQEELRPTNLSSQQNLAKAFELVSSQWPQCPNWYKLARHEQGISLIVVAPTELAGTVLKIVKPHSKDYVIEIGQGSTTLFEPIAHQVSITSGSVSRHHCNLHFTYRNGKSKICLLDNKSTHGTFILSRPPKHSSFRPLLEREITEGEEVDVKDVDFIRLGSMCLLAIENTGIKWARDFSDSDSDSDPEATTAVPEAGVAELLRKGWFFPRPLTANVAGMTTQRGGVTARPTVQTARTARAKP